jgi:C-terminal processing protease CtpA/Prc
MLVPHGPARMMRPDTDASWLPEDGWLDARETSGVPALWLADPANKFWMEHLVKAKALYVQVNEIGNKPEESLADFARRMLNYLVEHDIDRLILDLRLNRGGNGKLNRSLVASIIKARKIDTPGRLFVLIGRTTFSAAQFLVNDLEQFSQAIFVGEPTGGKINSYGDSRRIQLPNSGVTVRVSSLWWQVDERDQRDSTAPQVMAPLRYDDYRKNRDPALLAALAYGARSPSS